ncbi:MAG: hypothetical protein KF734_04820 [Saprospiraceae bacterium]|nr:hypothetical protein [Saprospiraceae bacterium]
MLDSLSAARILRSNMRPGERIIPFSRKDKRLIASKLRAKLLWMGLYVLSVAVLMVAFWVSCLQSSLWVLAVIFTLCLVLASTFFLLEKHPRLALRLFRDLDAGKKRVIFGKVEKVHFKQEGARPLEQIYEIGAYRFELGELSPVLKKFRQVMPGQVVEVHQCLHSGLILQLEVLGE